MQKQLHERQRKYEVQNAAAATAVQRNGRLALRFSERRLILRSGDIVMLLAALLLSQQLVGVRPLSAVPVGRMLLWASVLVGLWLVVGTIANVNDLQRAARPLASAWQAGGLALGVGTVYALLPLLTPPLPPSRTASALLPLLLTVGVATWRIVYALVFTQPVFRHRLLVVGAGRAGRTLVEMLSHPPIDRPSPQHSVTHEVVGFVDDDHSKAGATVAGVPVLGTSHSLLRLVELYRPDEVVLAVTYRQQMRLELLAALQDCREWGVEMTTMTSLFERVTGRVPVEHAGRDLTVILPPQRSLAFRFYQAAHRLFDVVAGLFGCLFLLLVTPFVWLLNRLTAPGDLFYRQERIGFQGRPFQIVKFRSMVMDAEKFSGAVWAGEGDPRITPAGRFLRKTRLDEAPQFWNLLKGDMSLIGPRPERPFFVRRLSQEIPFYRVRHAVKPGITGWAQVNYRYGASVDDALRKLEFDLYYIKHRGLYLDLQIALKTVRVIVGMAGR